MKRSQPSKISGGEKYTNRKEPPSNQLGAEAERNHKPVPKSVSTPALNSSKNIIAPNWYARIWYSYLGEYYEMVIHLENEMELTRSFTDEFLKRHEKDEKDDKVVENLPRRISSLIYKIKVFSCMGCLNDAPGQMEHIGGCLRDVSASQ